MEQMAEATVAICKCSESKKSYGVRFEKVRPREWKYTWAFKIKEEVAKREGYEGTRIEGNIYPDSDYPGCPYCGIKGFVVCDCSKLSCNISRGGSFTCEWCGMTGTLVDYTGSGFTTGGDR